MTAQLIQVVFILISIALVILVLLQQSKGGGIGASFGAGASATVFGARGAGSFLYKLTRAFAVLFFASGLLLGVVLNKELTVSIVDKPIQSTVIEELTTKPVDVPGKSADNKDAPSSDLPVQPE